mmetsp:Transcript_2024/g.5463  ORF Transcript_2024/g.5463 Transcript_2024/m.5463 type:complete len:255 (+) Transcript_2024:1491-2255(+)
MVANDLPNFSATGFSLLAMASSAMRSLASLFSMKYSSSGPGECTDRGTQAAPAAQTENSVTTYARDGFTKNATCRGSSAGAPASSPAIALAFSSTVARRSLNESATGSALGPDWMTAFSKPSVANLRSFRRMGTICMAGRGFAGFAAVLALALAFAAERSSFDRSFSTGSHSSESAVYPHQFTFTGARFFALTARTSALYQFPSSASARRPCVFKACCGCSTCTWRRKRTRASAGAARQTSCCCGTRWPACCAS